MKNLSISLALILTLISGQSALAELSETRSNPASAIETIVVIAAPEVAHFEIFSEKHSEQAVHQMMDYMVASLDHEHSVEANVTTEI